MLDQLRKHASSWMVKAVLTLIILTFIFFFGYSKYSSQFSNQQKYVASVGGIGIERRRYEMAYQAALNRMKDNFKGEIPAGFQDLLKHNVKDQLITREIMVQYAHQLGLDVSEEELARAIQSDKNLFPDGNFDFKTYQEVFLPHYRQKSGEDFEEVMKRELLIEKLQILMAGLFSPWQTELGKPEKDSTTSLSSEEIFSLWVNDFRGKVKVEVLERL